MRMLMNCPRERKRSAVDGYTNSRLTSPAVFPHTRCILSQVSFVDYGATLAPVAKSITVQLVAIHFALCFDATRAFLWDLTVVIFMRRPPPLPPGLWRLLKSIYGLQYQLLRMLEALGFVRSEFNDTLFIFHKAWGSNLIHCLLAKHDMVSSNDNLTLSSSIFFSPVSECATRCQ